MQGNKGLSSDSNVLTVVVLEQFDLIYFLIRSKCIWTTLSLHLNLDPGSWRPAEYLMTALCCMSWYFHFTWLMIGCIELTKAQFRLLNILQDDWSSDSRLARKLEYGLELLQVLADWYDFRFLGSPLSVDNRLFCLIVILECMLRWFAFCFVPLSADNRLLCLIAILACMLRIVCSVLWLS